MIADIADPPFRSRSVKRKILTGKRGVITIEAGEYFAHYTKVRAVHELHSLRQFKIGKRQKLQMVTLYFYYKYFLDSLIFEQQL